MLDIIIPVLNEEKILTEYRQYYQWLKNEAQLIFVDGGSKDRTLSLAQEFGKIILSPKGRAIQMNHGAREGQNQFLFFLHADTFITPAGLQRMKDVLSQGIKGGCLRLMIDDKKIIFRVFEWLVNLRARYFKVMDGDLGLFIRRDIFEQLGGFAEVPLMEDILFSRKLKRQKDILVLSEAIHVSSRVWHEKGFFCTFLHYTKVYINFWRQNNLRISHEPISI